VRANRAVKVPAPANAASQGHAASEVLCRCLHLRSEHGRHRSTICLHADPKTGTFCPCLEWRPARPSSKGERRR
jgi:hypothetical protein